MTDRELLQQALDALQEYVGVVVSVNDPNDWTPKVADAGEPARKAIEALRARLAQPEREWQGLTDEDKKQIAIEANNKSEMTAWEYAHRVGNFTEAKLKEKNSG